MSARSRDNILGVAHSTKQQLPIAIIVINRHRRCRNHYQVCRIATIIIIIIVIVVFIVRRTMTHLALQAFCCLNSKITFKNYECLFLESGFWLRSQFVQGQPPRHSAMKMKFHQVNSGWIRPAGFRIRASTLNALIGAMQPGNLTWWNSRFGSSFRAWPLMPFLLSSSIGRNPKTQDLAGRAHKDWSWVAMTYSQV